MTKTRHQGLSHLRALLIYFPSRPSLSHLCKLLTKSFPTTAWVISASYLLNHIPRRNLVSNLCRRLRLGCGGKRHSSFRICNKSNTSGLQTSYHSGAAEGITGFLWHSCCSIFSFFVLFLYINICLFVLFLLDIILFVVLWLIYVFYI
jgi:hypothetical protein